MKIHVDFKELENLGNRIDAEVKDLALGSMQKDILKDMAARLVRAVILRTPVGVYKHKQGGNLRRGWQVGSNDRDEVGDATVIRTNSGISDVIDVKVQKHGTVMSVYVYNPVRYAPYVEYGHRTAGGKGWVEGQFMMTTSARELAGVSDRVIESYLKRELEKVFS